MGVDGRDGPLGSGSGGGDDVALLRQVVAGSETAFATLYDRHAPAVLRVALTLSRDRTVAEDVVQETFLALWNRAELFDPSLGSLAAWLLTIARNRALDRLRAAARRVPATPFSAFVSDERDEASTRDWLVESGNVLAAGSMAPEPELALAASETRAVVGAAIATLDGAERQAILLAYQDGLTQAEIATRLGWPLGTVKTRSRRALHRMRDSLATEQASEWSRSGSS
jgi:RNA polymerase sigma-70 factor (ECF subfamily)